MSAVTFAWACACMGPVYGEPLCPCDMKRKGLPSSPEHEAAIVKANKELDALFGPGGEFHKPSPEPSHGE